jgi:hypothetical protein
VTRKTVRTPLLSELPYSDVILFPISSSSSSLILRVIALIVCLFFDFLFNVSTSTSLISLRISFILKMNFPLITIYFLFLHSLHIYNSSLNLVFSFYKRVTLEVVLLKATPTRLIYYFIGVLRVEEQTILLTSNVTSYSSIPSSSELSSKE